MNRGYKVDTTPDSASGAIITKSAGITTVSVVIAQDRIDRIGMMIWNPTANSVYISYSADCNGNTQSAIILNNTTWVMPSPIYTGVISCMRNAGSGSVNVTELIR